MPPIRTPAALGPDPLRRLPCLAWLALGIPLLADRAAPAGCPGTARCRAAGTPVGHAADGRLMALYRGDPALPGQHRAGARAHEAGLHRDRGRPLLPAPRRRLTRACARAIWLLATTGDKHVPGGSTITQQVARNFFLSSRRPTRASSPRSSRPADRARAEQGPDLAAVSQQDVLRQPRLRRRRRGGVSTTARRWTS